MCMHLRSVINHAPSPMYNTCFWFFFFIWEHQTKTSACNSVLEQAREDLYPMYEYEIPYYETNDKFIDLDVLFTNVIVTNNFHPAMTSIQFS
jgi:hypothetical protein